MKELTGQPKRYRYYEGVRYLSKGHATPHGWMQCGQCGRSWDDDKPTRWTPAPSGRCPFEYMHRYQAVTRG